MRQPQDAMWALSSVASMLNWVRSGREDKESRLWGEAGHAGRLLAVDASYGSLCVTLCRCRSCWSMLSHAFGSAIIVVCLECLWLVLACVAQMLCFLLLFIVTSWERPGVLLHLQIAVVLDSLQESGYFSSSCYSPRDTLLCCSSLLRPQRTCCVVVVSILGACYDVVL